MTETFEFGDNYVRMVVPYNWIEEQEKVTGKVTEGVTEGVIDTTRISYYVSLRQIRQLQYRE